MNSNTSPLSLNGKRILVVGGTGFIGRRVVARLNAAGSIVKIASRKAPQNLDVAWSPVAYGTYDEWVEITRSIEIIIHAAHSNTPSGVDADIIGDLQHNIPPLLGLLEACKKSDVSRFIFASSGGTVYGNVTQQIPIDESHPTNPTSAYGIHKLIMEKYIQAFQQRHQFAVRILRLANPYGPSQTSRPGFGIVPTFIAALNSDSQIQIIGDGSMRRDYIYIDDVAEAFVAACTDNASLLEIINVGSGIATSVSELLVSLERLSGKRANIFKSPHRTFDVPYNALNIDRAYSRLKWEPTISLERGLRLTLQSFRQAN